MISECKRKLTVYSGLHIGGPFEILKDEVLEAEPDANTILLGDIVDLATCPRNEKNIYFTMFRYLQYRHGDKYVFGDEERMTTEDLHFKGPDFVAVYGSYQMHPVKSMQYRSKPWGSGWLRRKIISYRKPRQLETVHPGMAFLERAVEIAKFYKVRTFICGYFHPGKIIESEYKGIKIIIVPRGKTEIWI